MPIKYNKLVRDRIPEIIRQDGSQCEIETMNEDDYKQALCAKVLEEAAEVARAIEVAEATNETLLTELADLYEVLDTLLKVYTISVESVRTRQVERHAQRGGFEQRIRLLHVYPTD